MTKTDHHLPGFTANANTEESSEGSRIAEQNRAALELRERVAGYTSDSDIRSFQEAEILADIRTKETGDRHIAVEHLSSYPKYGAVRVPQVGDEVSDGFNGDYYPQGVVVKVTNQLEVVTSTGRRYRRVRRSGAWRSNRMWWMCRGHISRLNPSF